MKRAELVVGKRYAWNTYHDFIQNGWHNKQVEVVDTGHWERDSYSYWARKDKPPVTLIVNGVTHTLPSSFKMYQKPVQGSGVLIEYINDKGERTRNYAIVRLMDIKGEWGDIKAKVDEYDKARREAQAKATAEYERKRTKFSEVKATLLEYGIDVQQAGKSWGFISLTESNTDKLLVLLREVAPEGHRN